MRACVYTYELSGSFHIEVGWFWLTIAKYSGFHVSLGQKCSSTVVETGQLCQFHLLHQRTHTERLRSPQGLLTILSHSQTCVILVITWKWSLLPLFFLNWKMFHTQFLSIKTWEISLQISPQNTYFILKAILPVCIFVCVSESSLMLTELVQVWGENELERVLEKANLSLYVGAVFSNYLGYQLSWSSGRTEGENCSQQ